MMKRFFSIYILSGLLITLNSNNAAAQVPGDTEYQEKGDMVWRDLQIPVDEHPGIYDKYTIGDPRDHANHWMVEMQGPEEGIRLIQLSTFEQASGQYHGAYNPRDPNVGGPRILLREKRKSISDTAQALLSLGGIEYVQSAVSDYISFSGLGANNTLDPGEITAMRSDAFAEYCYAANGVPNVVIGGQTIVTAPALFEAKGSIVGLCSGEKLCPSDARREMEPAVIENPTVEVKTVDGSKIPSGGVTRAKSITIRVTDLFSGPGRLELWNGPIDPAGVPFRVNNEDFEDVVHDYSATDVNLGMLADMPEGQWTIRAIDQAGNEAQVGFVVTHSPAVSVETEPGKIPLAVDISGRHSIQPSTLWNAFSFEITDRQRAGGSQHLGCLWPVDGPG